MRGAGFRNYAGPCSSFFKLSACLGARSDYVPVQRAHFPDLEGTLSRVDEASLPVDAVVLLFGLPGNVSSETIKRYIGEQKSR
jgi:hypothetical protein